jgi:signal transduction histidine kinase
MGRAELAYKTALTLGRQVYDSIWVANIWNRLGDFYGLEERSHHALDCYLKSLNLQQKYKGSARALIDNYMGITKSYIRLNDLNSAENYLEKARKLKIETKDTAAMGVLDISQADIYRKRGQYELAEKLYLKNIAKRQKKNNYEGLIIVYFALAQNYDEWKKYNEAELYYQKALEAATVVKRQRSIGLILLKMGEMYQKQDLMIKAKDAFYRAVKECDDVDSRVYQTNAYRNLYQLAQKESKLNQALSYMKRYIEVQDTIHKEVLNTKLEDLKASFVLKEREKELQELDIENQKNKKNQYILLFCIGGLLTLSVFLIILYQSRNKALKNLHTEQSQTQALLTEKENLLEQIQQSNLHLMHTEKMASLGVMMAGIAHELNNPIGSINASIEALKMDNQELMPLLQYLANIEPSEQMALQPKLNQLLQQTDVKIIAAEIEQLMQSISNSTQRTAQIIGGLRTFARDTGEVFLPYRIEEGIEATLTLLHHKINPDIQIIKTYDTIHEVSCQVSKINQVFLNILDNAVQSLHGKGQIMINTYEFENDCVIKISDTGEGMEDATKNRIFEPFFTTKEVGKGMGLGLSISYAIIQQHKGTINVETGIGKGTTFTICLPFSRSTNKQLNQA